VVGLSALVLLAVPRRSGLVEEDELPAETEMVLPELAPAGA
jgi:hypothetical protein